MRCGFLRFSLGTGWRMVWKRMRLEAGRPVKRLHQNSLGQALKLALHSGGGEEKRHLHGGIYGI